MSPYEKLGKRLAHALEMVNCDAVDVAELLSVALEIVKKLLNGESYSLSIELAVRVAELAGCELIPVEQEEDD